MISILSLYYFELLWRWVDVAIRYYHIILIDRFAVHIFQCVRFAKRSPDPQIPSKRRVIAASNLV